MSGMYHTTWRKLIKEAMADSAETFDDMVAISDGVDLDKVFHCGHGSVEGAPFLLWTTKNVYFPVQYDGAEWADFVPREPTNKGMKHIG